MKNCKKGYSCGATCINRERSCSKELTGQAIEIASVLAKRIQEAAPPSPAKTPKAARTPKIVELEISSNVSQIKEAFREWSSFKDYDHLSKDNSDPEQSRKSKDSEAMVDIFRSLLSGYRGGRGNPKLVGSFDKSGRLQALCAYSPSSNYIDDLASAPWNASSKPDARKTKGAGTHALAAAINNMDGEAELWALSSARPYYEKVGFKAIRDDRGDYKIDKTAARKLVKKAGFDPEF